MNPALSYILPYSEEHYEFCQWLVSEVDSLGGEAAFVGAEKIETIHGRNDTMCRIFCIYP